MSGTVLAPPPARSSGFGTRVPGTSALEAPDLPGLASRSPPMTRVVGATLARVSARLWKSGAGRSDSVRVSALGFASLTPDLVVAGR